MYTSNPNSPRSNDNKTAAGKTEAVRETVVEMKDDLRDVANRAGKTVRGMFDTAAHEVSHARDTVTAQIKEKPVQSSLIALGAGFLLGALFRR